MREVTSITEAEFLRDHLGPGRPLLIRGGASSWPAASWNWDRLEVIGRGVPVRCEVGDTMQGANSLLETTLAEYVADLRAERIRGGTYLTQFSLFDALPELRADVDFSLLRSRRVRRALAWIGPAGTRTGIHCDHADNLLAQIVGRKRFRLARPGERDRLYPSRKYDFFSDLSSVDSRNWDRTRHPNFDSVDWAEVEMEPGDLLFNPSGWWHEVDAIEPSISVNVFAVSMPGLIRRSPLLVKEGLHLAGLYRRNWCTCHGRSPQPLEV
jgi:ribosomal protein L16 Arg81 hydroxylase